MITLLQACKGSTRSLEEAQGKQQVEIPKTLSETETEKALEECQDKLSTIIEHIKGRFPRPSKTPTRCLVYCWTGKRDATKIGKTLSKK